MSAYAWMDQALCAQTDPDLFHPEKAGDHYRNARRICGSCPVQQQCRDFADRVEDDAGEGRRWGLWASQTPRQRAA
jgi:hypothetical protein